MLGPEPTQRLGDDRGAVRIRDADHLSRTPAGFASGPSRFMIVVTPSSRRTGPTCRIAG